MSSNLTVISIQDKDAVLIRAQRGDREALNLLFDSYRNQLLASARRILPRPQDAEDAVQEAMLAAFKHLHEFGRRAEFSTWLTRIVINAALMQIRKARCRPTISWDQQDTPVGEASLKETVRDQKPNPEQIYGQTEEEAVLHEALGRLPANYQRAIRLCDLENRTLKNAARILGVSLGTLKAQLHRGRLSLTRKLKYNLNFGCGYAAAKPNPRNYAAGAQKLRAA